MALGAAESIEAEMHRIKDIFDRSSASGNRDPAYGPLLAHMQQMGTQCQHTKTACRKVGLFFD